MKTITRLNHVTLETEVSTGQDPYLVKGCAFAVTKSSEPVYFHIRIQSLESGRIRLAKEVRLPPVLTNHQIQPTLRAAGLVNTQCDIYMEAIERIQGGELEHIVKELFQMQQWDMAAQMLALAQVIPDTLRGTVATSILVQFAKEDEPHGSLCLTRRLRGRVGKDLFEQLVKLMPFASEAIIKQCEAYREMRLLGCKD